MNKTLACLKLDFRLTKPFAAALFVSPLLILFDGMIESPYLLRFYLMIMLLISGSYPFIVGAADDINMLYGTLPVKRRNVVVARYLFFLLLEIMIAAVMLIEVYYLQHIPGTSIDLTAQLPSLSVLYGMFTFIIAIQYLIYFAVVYNLLTYMIPVVASVTVMAMVIPTGESEFFESMGNLVYFLPLIGILFLVFSCFLSRKLYAKRDI